MIAKYVIIITQKRKVVNSDFSIASIASQMPYSMPSYILPVLKSTYINSLSSSEITLSGRRSDVSIIS